MQRVILILMFATHGMRTAPLVTRNRVVKSVASLIKPRPHPASKFQAQKTPVPLIRMFPTFPSFPSICAYAYIPHERFVKSCTFSICFVFSFIEISFVDKIL